MNTYLGASAQLGPADVDADLVARAQVLYLEGYLWDEPEAKEAYRLAARTAHEAGNRVAFTLSDSFCVDRHRDEFLDLVESRGRRALRQRGRDHVALRGRRLRRRAPAGAAPLRDRRADPQRDGRGDRRAATRCTWSTPTRVGEVVDTTGAGDQFAAGFLYGFTHGYDLGTAARLGALAAGEVISHLGARPATSLAELAGPAARPADAAR